MSPLFLFLSTTKERIPMVEMNRNHNAVYITKEDGDNFIIVVARKMTNELFEITYFSNGVTKVLTSARLLVVRMVSGLMGLTYEKVCIAFRGVL